MKRVNTVGRAVVALALAAPNCAHAILEGCDVSATNLAFGVYDPLSAAARDSVGTVIVSCSVTLVGLLVSWDIQLSTGGSGSYASRRMTAGAQTLAYNIYTNPTRTVVWGDGTAGTGRVSETKLLAVGVTQSVYAAYGRIPAAQDRPPGTYTDSIVVTLTF